MRKTKYFIPLLKETPVEASVISHQLMLRSGMIRQLSSGIYTWLPLGLKVLKNIAAVIRKHMDSIDSCEVLMSCIQPAELWKQSNRYDDYGPEMLRIKDRHDHEMLFGPTNEEVVSDLFKNNVTSYKNLPVILHQIQWKFRDEIRPRFGVMRGREFLMKDAYSFDLDAEKAQDTYFKILNTYLNIFRDLSVEAIPIRADSGPIGGDLNHEFHILANTGESKIYCDKNYKNINFRNTEGLNSLYAVTEEKYDPSQLPIPIDQIIEKRGIEVGHIFYFGTKYSEAFDIKISDSLGNRNLVHMGSYGIGVSRMVAALIEANHDDQGIIWPISVAPFKVSIINIKINDKLTCALAEECYTRLIDAGLDVLYDDDNSSPGNKFAANDLIGIPIHIIISQNSIDNNSLEIKDRRTGHKEKLSINEAINKVISLCKSNV